MTTPNLSRTANHHLRHCGHCSPPRRARHDRPPQPRHGSEGNQLGRIGLKAALDETVIANRQATLGQAARQALDNTSEYTLHGCVKGQQIKADFEDDVGGFSPCVQGILDDFEFCNQAPYLMRAYALGSAVEALATADGNLSLGGRLRRIWVAGVLAVARGGAGPATTSRTAPAVNRCGCIHRLRRKEGCADRVPSLYRTDHIKSRRRWPP